MQHDRERNRSGVLGRLCSIIRARIGVVEGPNRSPGDLCDYSPRRNQIHARVYVLPLLSEADLVAPRWLVINGQLAEAQRVIAALEPSTFDDPVAVLKTRVILESLEGVSIRKSDLLTGGPSQNLRRTLIGASSQILQQVRFELCCARRGVDGEIDSWLQRYYLLRSHHL